MPIDTMKLCNHRLLPFFLKAKEQNTDVGYAFYSTIQHRPPGVLFC